MTDANAAGKDPSAARGHEQEYPQAEHNFRVLVGDVTCFFVGMAFLDAATVLPALVLRLGGDEALLGIIAAMRQAAYFLPQVLVAHHLQKRIAQRGPAYGYLPFVLRVCFWGRIWFFVAAAGLLFFGGVAPKIALTILVVAYVFSWIGDGMGGVPWTSIVGRTVPPLRRGRLFATTQVLGSVGRIGVGVLVARILSEKWDAAFPVKGALIVLGCGIFMALSWVFLALIREPPRHEVPAEESERVPALSLREYLSALPGHLRARPDFGRLAVAQVLGGAAGAASLFYLEHARNTLPGGLPGGIAGTFLVVQTAGLLLCAPFWGWINDRRGPRAALIYLLAAALLSPLLAGLGGILKVSSSVSLLLFFAAYFTLGAVQDGWATFTNYVLEAVPSGQHPTYIALMSALNAPSLLLPLLAGFLVKATGATTAFAFLFALLVVALLVVRTLPDTRRRSVAASF